MTLLGALVLGLTSTAHAECPAEEPVLAELGCDSSVAADLQVAEPSEWDWIYECGSPDDGLYQAGPEDLYSFTCPSAGEVTVEVHDALCDFDLYVLSDECSPRGGSCLSGNTGLALDPIETTFSCDFEGQTRYIVIEGKGLETPAGLCTAPTAGEYVVKFDTTFGACDIEPLAVSEDPIPGVAGVDNTFRGEGGTGGETAYLVVGTGLGESIELPGCPGLFLPVTGYHRLGPDNINPGGFIERTSFIPELASGLTTYITFVDLVSCEVAEPYRYDWP